MAYAPHSNQDVQHELMAGHIPTSKPLVLGSFKETEHDNLFEFAERRHPDDSFHPDMPHIIYVGPLGSETRLAKVLKTVAYVVTDEDVIEKWVIKGHKVYNTEWVKA